MDEKEHIRLIGGSANSELAEEISSKLGVPLTPIEVKRFNDGEIYCKVKNSVRGCKVFVIQSTSNPVNENLMELLILVDALKRASAKEITAIIPYYGYGRQDRKAEPREPITAKLVANLLTKAGVDRVITFDLHVEQIQGFFDIPVDNLEAIPQIAEYLLDKKIVDPIVVSPDVGGTKRAIRLAKLIDAPLAIIDKRRPAHGESKIMNVVGEVKGKTVILIDDIIDTAGTISKAAEVMLEKGAREVYICASHAVFSGKAIEKLGSDAIKEVIVTNTIKIADEKKIGKIKIISVASLLSESIKRVYEGLPLGVLFEGIYDRLAKKR
ncbi:MAG: ribose-phosphate pyrophosphokinase [Candidatus Woesearchaeota archaeon]|jgi:ribose-phosphate pyrophosphokinase|nr:ribose-phosphate pyrophosphokinase [Gammaproteobacteria bacterium]MDP7179914.1 ribose-phosphate pyrophosphokinase [Candidatus Woesearchaeota archaeon]